MGMDGYLSKPFIHEKQNEVLKPFLPTGSEGALAAPIDLNAAMKAVSGGAEFLREALGVFLEQDYPRHLAALQEGIARHEARAVQRAAHGLQGPLSSFGCRAAVEIARHLEKMAREGNLDGVSSALEELELEANRAASYIGTLLQNELEPTTG